jgi:methyltransferase (TIGR00027 family)
VDETRASTTALGSSLMRAVHTRLDRPPLIDDPWGDRLVLESERQAVAKLILRGLDPATRAQIDTLDSVAALDAALRAHLGYGWAIVRTRYAEDALEAAVAGGVRQYVILGAGFDSFALRQPTFAREVAIFEIDHPTTQNLNGNGFATAASPCLETYTSCLPTWVRRSPAQPWRARASARRNRLSSPG